MKSARTHAVPSGPATPRLRLFWLQADEGCLREREWEMEQKKNGLRSEGMDTCYVPRVLRADVEESREADN